MTASKNLGPIKTIQTYELVANQIQRAVHVGLLMPGDRLPSERALAEQLGVARMTVREAVRVLAHEGRITVRRGVRGGMWIRAQDFSKRELVRLAADTDRAIVDVYEFREVIERASARFAADRATPKDISKLRNLSVSMEKVLAAHIESPDVSSNVSKFLALDSQFHIEIAKIGGNPFVSEAVERSVAARYVPFGAVFRVLSPNATKGHDELVDAIAAGDANRADKIMATHVSEARSKLISILHRHVRAQTAE